MREVNRDLLCQVVEHDGMVRLLFSTQEEDGLTPAMTDNFIIAADAALSVAEMITQMAFEADTKLKPVGETLKASLVEKHRERLIPRVALMLGSMREDKLKTNGQIALDIVDAACKEIFT